MSASAPVRRLETDKMLPAFEARILAGRRACRALLCGASMFLTPQRPGCPDRRYRDHPCHAHRHAQSCRLRADRRADHQPVGLTCWPHLVMIEWKELGTCGPARQVRRLRGCLFGGTGRAGATTLCGASARPVGHPHCGTDLACGPCRHRGVARGDHSKRRWRKQRGRRHLKSGWLARFRDDAEDGCMRAGVAARS